MTRQVRLPGTYRGATPDQTWTAATRLFSRAGITRVCDVTNLDCIGIPVALAVRPASGNLAVSQGKGATLALAKVSAAMESLELWHAEQPINPDMQSPARRLSLPYALSSLMGRRLQDEHLREVVMNWTTARGLLTRMEVPVPVDSVRINFGDEPEWHVRGFIPSSNGIASGNSFSEAALHALYEVVERHATGQLRRRREDRRQTIDVRSIDDPHLVGLVERLTNAGVSVEVAMVPNALEVRCAVAHIWSVDFPVVCAGAGAHSDPVVAVSRALTEAVQSRLTHITGTRDDVPSRGDSTRLTISPLLTQGENAWAAVSTFAAPLPSFDDELTQVAERVLRVTGTEPLVVRFDSPTPDLAFVKVIAPGLSHGNLSMVPI